MYKSFSYLRMRDPSRYDTIWNMVRKTLNTTDYDVLWADVFPGRYEAEFSWIAANLLSKGFVSYKFQLFKHYILCKGFVRYLRN